MLELVSLGWRKTLRTLLSPRWYLVRLVSTMIVGYNACLMNLSNFWIGLLVLVAIVDFFTSLYKWEIGDYDK